MTRRQGALVALAAVVAAISNFVCMIVAKRALGPGAAYEEFLVFWSLMFGVYGVLSGIQNEATRANGAVAEGRAPGVRMLVPAAVIGGAVSLLVAVLFPLFSDATVPISGWGAGGVLVATGLWYALHVTMVGATAGRGLWDHYAGMLGGEVTLRMVLLGAYGALGLGLVGLQWACLLAIAVTLVFLVASPRARGAFLGRADGAFGPELRRTLLAVFSTSCTAVLVTAYPAIMKGTGSSRDAALGAALILTVSLCRAPIMMPLTSFQGVAIKAFLAHRDAPLRAIAKPTAVFGVLGVVGAVGAWLVGPPFVRIAFGADLDVVPGWVYAALTFFSVFLALLTLLGALALAVDRHGLYALGWLTASAVAIAILVAVQEPTTRVVASLAIGPVVGCLVFLVGLLLPSRAAAQSSAT